MDSLPSSDSSEEESSSSEEEEGDTQKKPEMEMAIIKAYPAYEPKTITHDPHFRGSFGTDSPHKVQKTVFKLEKPGNEQKQIYAKQSFQKSKLPGQVPPEK